MNASTRTGLGWGARLLIGLVLIIAGAAAATWGLAHYQPAARLLGVVPAAQPAQPGPKPMLLTQQATPPTAQSGGGEAEEQRIGQLENRLSRVENATARAEGSAGRADALVVAFAARRAIDRGIGLGYIEGQLRERFGATQPRAVATVIKAARAPVTIEDLRLGLDSIGPDLVSGGHGDFWSGLRNAVANLVVLHKEGSPSPRPSARMARARRLLEAGQVEAALAEIERLPGASGAQRWLAAAHRYVDARRALDVIETAAILGQGAPVTASPPSAPNAPGAPTPAPERQPAARAAKPTT